MHPVCAVITLPYIRRYAMYPTNTPDYCRFCSSRLRTPAVIIVTVNYSHLLPFYCRVVQFGDDMLITVRLSVAYCTVGRCNEYGEGEVRGSQLEESRMAGALYLSVFQ